MLAILVESHCGPQSFVDIRRLVISQNIREKYKNKCRLVKTHSKPNRPTRSNPACLLLFSCSGKSSGTAGLCYLHFLGDPLHASWQSHDAFFEMKDQLSLSRVKVSVAPATLCWSNEL